MGVNRPKNPIPRYPPPKTVPDDPNRHDAYGITPNNFQWLYKQDLSKVKYNPNDPYAKTRHSLDLANGALKQSQQRANGKKLLWGRYGTPSQVDLELAYAAGNAVPTPPGAKSSDYWLDPYRIARYHNVLKNAPAGYKPPEWMDAQAIESAYKYLEYRNGGKPWYKWKALSDDDPAAEWLRSWKLPDPVDAPDREFKLLQQQEPDTPYTFDDVEGTSGISDEEWAKLPGWQKVIIPLLSSGSWQAGAAMGAATTLPFGAVASIASANPIPLLASAGLGAGLGALFGLVGDNAPVLAKALMALDAPAEGIERVAGLGWQIAGSLSDPDKYGSVMTVLNNLPAAWKAGTIGYDVIPGGISGEAVQLGKAEPVALDENMIGLAAIVGLRNDIQAIESGKSKESLEDIYQKYRDVLGFAGMGTDLLGHMVLDPLNLAGMGGKGAIKGVAKLSKNTQLLDAVQSVSKSDGVSRVLQMYKIELGKLPDEQAVKMGKLNQWLAGIAKVEDGKPVYKTFDNTPTVYDKAGILKWIPGVNIPWLLHLDPKSRALEAVYTGVDNLRLMMVDEPNPVNINKTVMAAGNILPENAGNVTLAGFMKGKDGAVFPLAMRDAAPRLNELLDNLWLLPADKRLFYTDLAKALNVDIYKLVKDIDDYRGKPTLTAWLKNRLNEADTPEAKNLIARMDAANDPITPGRILNDIDEYKKGNFVMTADEYKANMIMVMDDILSDWAVKFYGVKPDALLGRLAHTIKTAQSFVLLGGNPNYLFNNLFDNIGAMSYAGVFELSRRGTRDNFFSRIGFEPLRRRSGITSAEVGGKQVTSVGGKIIEASTKEGLLTSLDKKIHKATDKVGLFTKGSAVVEAESSDMVTYTTMRRFTDQNWKAGKGFDRIDPAIESSLKALGIDVEKEYYRAINGSLNETELNANVWQGMKKYALEKMADEGQLEIIEQAGLKDFLNERLAKAVDDDGVSQAFKETFAEMQKNMDDTVAQNAGYTIEHAFHETLLEGFQATISKFDEIAEEMGQFWNKYSHSLDDVWKEADKIPDKRKRAAFKKRKFDEFDKDWQRQKKLETQKMMGVIKAFGGDQAVADSRTATYLNERINLNLVWDNYYYTRRKMMNLYYMARYDGDRSALVDLASMIERALGPEVMKELDSLPSEVLEKNIYSYIKRSMSSLYDDAMDLEMDFQTRIDDVFVDMFDQQFPGGRPAAEAWRRGTRDIRTMMSEAQRYFRDGKAITQLPEDQAALLKGGIDNILHGMTLDDMSREDRSAAWLRFNEEVYRPLINDLMLTNQRKAADMYRTSVQANSGVPIQAMTPQNMTPKQATGYIRRIASEEYGIPQGTPTKQVAQPTSQTKLPHELSRAEYNKTTKYSAWIASVKDDHRKKATSIKVNGKTLEEIALEDAKLNLTARQFADKHTELYKYFNVDDKLIARGDLENFYRTIREDNGLDFFAANNYVTGGGTAVNTTADDTHYNAVEKALSQGLPVHKENLITYPDLAAKYPNAKSNITQTPQVVPQQAAQIPPTTAKSYDDVLLDIINNFTGNAFKSLDEVDADSARQAFDAWGAQRVGITPEEFAHQRHGMTLDELRQWYSDNKTGRKKKQTTTEAPKQGALFEDIDNVPPPPAVINPLGTADAHRTTPPIEVMQHQDWMDNIRPALEDLEAKYHSTESNAPTGFAERIQQAGRANGMSEEQITELIRKVKAHTAKVGTQQKDLIYTAYKYGLSMRDHVLLNYSRRTNFDNAMNLIFPYSFWATNAGQQWALRALDRPAMMANFARLKDFQQNTVNRPGFPTRLRNKIGINMPFLPDWMGETVFIDPLRRIFPFNQFFQPIDRLKDQNNMTYKKAITILQDMVNSDEVSQAEALQAYNTQTGELWQKVVTQAKAEIDGDIANPFDVISLMYGPSLPIQWAYQTIMGRQDQIGQLPLTRTIQNATVALGIGGPAGFNLEAPIRKALGLPEVDQFYDYRVDKALSDLTADGVIKPDDAVRAMIERKGEIYDQARERVAKEGLLKFAGAPLSLDFFPEGEQHQRALRDKYSKAIDAYANGDTEAINEFFEQYPEYDVQLQAWRDPQERLRRFLRSQIWESYNALEGPNKGVIRNRFGELFQDAFINKATRSYDSIDTQTLAMWAGALNNKVPESKEFIQPATIEEMKPLISETIPGTEMYEPEQAQAVKEYWDEREKQFPGVLDLQTIYYGSSKADRRNLITIYPQLKKYWDWNRAYKANHPLVADYVEKQSAIYEQQDMQSTLKEIDPIMLKALSQYTTGIPLGNGARTYLYQVWVDNGKPLGTFEKYLDSLANILADY